MSEDPRQCPSCDCIVSSPVPMVEHPFFLEGQLEVLQELLGILEDDIELTRTHLHNTYATEDYRWSDGLPREVSAGRTNVQVAAEDLERLDVDLSLFITKVRETLTHTRWKLARNKEQYS